jgi:tetratricopeptide (TPR) repeat protein
VSPARIAVSGRQKIVVILAEERRDQTVDPQYANAHHFYGDYLSTRSRHGEAIAEAKRALELDPLNLMISTWVGFRYYMARDYSRAID